MKGSDEAQILGLGDETIAPSLVAAAHELKSPLATIRQLTLGIDVSGLDSVTQQSLERIVLTSERALRLTSDVTRHARLEDSLFECEPLNPSVVCEDVARELSPLFAAHNKKIEVAPTRRGRLVVANRELLRRILLNFGDNALRYTNHDDSVKLSINSVDGQHVRINVRDYGPSISPKVWSALEEGIGSRAQPLPSRPDGSGLGLLVARQFAEVMHGSVGVTRHRDGASFFVDLQASTQLSLL